MKTIHEHHESKVLSSCYLSRAWKIVYSGCVLFHQGLFVCEIVSAAGATSDWPEQFVTALDLQQGKIGRGDIAQLKNQENRRT